MHLSKDMEEVPGYSLDHSIKGLLMLAGKLLLIYDRGHCCEKLWFSMFFVLCECLLIWYLLLNFNDINSLVKPKQINEIFIRCQVWKTFNVTQFWRHAASISKSKIDSLWSKVITTFHHMMNSRLVSAKWNSVVFK